MPQATQLADPVFFSAILDNAVIRFNDRGRSLLRKNSANDVTVNGRNRITMVTTQGSL